MAWSRVQCQWRWDWAMRRSLIQLRDLATSNWAWSWGSDSPAEAVAQWILSELGTLGALA